MRQAAAIAAILSVLWLGAGVANPEPMGIDRGESGFGRNRRRCSAADAIWAAAQRNGQSRVEAVAGGGGV